MRLTVGPLPAAVYWRRRAVVLVGLAMVVLVISYACGGPGRSTAGNTGQPSANPSETVLRPTVEGTPPSGPPGQPAFTLPATGATGPCTDAEMEVTAGAGAAEVQLGQPVGMTIKIKNVSGRTCDRDVGADVQELRLKDGATVIVWSSDDCGANKGHDVRPFGPGKEVSFTLTWPGKRSRTGDGSVNCNAPPPDANVYQLEARLDQLLSAAFALRIR